MNNENNVASVSLNDQASKLTESIDVLLAKATVAERWIGDDFHKPIIDDNLKNMKDVNKQLAESYAKHGVSDEDIADLNELHDTVKEFVDYVEQKAAETRSLQLKAFKEIIGVLEGTGDTSIVINNLYPEFINQIKEAIADIEKAVMPASVAQGSFTKAFRAYSALHIRG